METYTSDIDLYKSIDGNPIKNPVGYCMYHKGYVSDRQAKVHRCFRKHGGTCGRMKDMEGRNIRKMTSQQYYDKVVDRLTKMETVLIRMGKALENISKTLDMMEKNEETMLNIDREGSICKE